jgi:4'-phosphopantetheinyl transferase
MPVYFTTDLPFGQLAIWKIEESLDALKSTVNALAPSSLPKKQLEFYAARQLLQKMVEEPINWRLLKQSANGKPYFDHAPFGNFSLSHSYPYVASVVSQNHLVGIDIQCWHARMEKLQHKFLSNAEISYCHGDEKWMTLFWSAKEAIYKCLDLEGAEFKDDLLIDLESITTDTFEMHYHHRTGSGQTLCYYKFFEDFTLCVTSK